MKKLNQWVDWQWHEKDGKKTKILVQRNGKWGSSVDPKTWTKYKKTGKQRGFILTANDPYILVDLDHCSNGGKPDKWAKKIIKKLKPKFIDISPSGDGLHLFMKGELPENHKRKPMFKGKQVEVYQEKRFVTMPENSYLGDIKSIEEMSAKSLQWLEDLTHRKEVINEYADVKSGLTVKQVKKQMKTLGTWAKVKDGIDEDGTRWGSDSDFKFLNQITDVIGVADASLIAEVYNASKIVRDKVEDRIEYHVANMLRVHEFPMSLGGESVPLGKSGDTNDVVIKKGMGEQEIKSALLEASKEGAYNLNEVKQEIKEVTGIALGTLDKMVKEEVASSLDEYFEGHVCWDSVRGVFMEVRDDAIRNIKKANSNQTVMSASGWMTPSDVGDVLHGAENVYSEYRPDVTKRYFDSNSGSKKLNLYYNVPAEGKGKKMPKLINKVLDNLFLSDPEAKEYFIQWLAYIVQTGKRTGVAWGFHGAETGTGKGLIVDVINEMLGLDNCAINVGNSQLSEKFTGYTDCKQFVHFNEIAINAQSRHEIAGKLKSIVSDDFIQLRLMGTDTFTVTNYCNVILNSNKHNPLELEANDRRWNIINTESKLDYLKWFGVDTGKEVVAESLEFKAWLMNVELDTKMATQIMSKSVAKQNIIEATTSSVELLAQKINKGEDFISFLDISKKDIYYSDIKDAIKRRKFSNNILLHLFKIVSGNDTSSVIEMNRYFKKPYIQGVADVFDDVNRKSVRGVSLITL